MRTTMIVGAALLVSLGAPVSSASAQVLPAAKCLATGFTPTAPEHPELMQQRANAGSYAFGATRAQGSFPDWSVGDRHITLGCAWSVNMFAERLIPMMLEAPEDPAEDRVTMRSDPAGKQAFRGGVLTFTKWTYHSVGIDTVPDLITYRGVWHGAVSGGILTISVDNVLGSKDAIAGWIAEVIDSTAGE
jgi:hypothetical protein